MTSELNPMDKFDFLIGRWKMEYNIPKSKFSLADSGRGEGVFKRILDNNYVTFDYTAEFSQSKGSAHAIFGWDKKNNIYQYWWFEDSGEFNRATCEFIDENTLCMNWDKGTLVQTFSKQENGDVLLEMRYPKDKNDFEIILKVTLKKSK